MAVTFFTPPLDDVEIAAQPTPKMRPLKRRRSAADGHAGGPDESQLHDLARRLVSAQEDERRRIARELHDNVNQRLALLAMEIEQLMAATAADDPLRLRLSRLWQRTSEVSREVHSLSHELHSSTLEALGVVAAMRTLSRELSAQGLEVTFSGDAVSSDVSSAAALGLFRIAQEALLNVRKHSGAGEATLCLSREDGMIALRIEDRGCGFDPADHRDGLGLLSMQERLLPLDGELAIWSRPGSGTVIEARVPRSGPEVDGPAGRHRGER